jgi:hypothetical protein
MKTQKQNEDFLESGPTLLFKCQEFMATVSLKRTLLVVPSEK